MSAPSIAYVVPTKDRPDDLRSLMTSLVGQTVAPDQVVVVDGSAESIEPIVDEFRDRLAVDYVRVLPPSLARQRNAGMAEVRPGIEIAGYLDDDLVLQPDATERMREFWSVAEPEVGGASFSIINQPSFTPAWIERLFLINGSPPGTMLRSGFATSIPYLTETTPTEWLYGGATLFRRSVVDRFAYDEWYVGHGYLEDVDYSYRVSREFALYVVGSARVHHYSRPPSPESLQVIGRQEIINRLYFTRKAGAFSPWATWWALLGVVLLNVWTTVKTRDRFAARRVLGNATSLRAVLARRTDSYGGNWK